MKKILFVMVALPAIACASGPRYVAPDANTQSEFVNVYHDLSYPVWTNAAGSSATLSFINVSSIVVNGVNYSRSSAAGSNTQIQYNNAGALGGVSGFTYSGSSVSYSGTLGAAALNGVQNDSGGRSIYGNFVASNTVSAGSSVTVNVSGYTGYVARIYMLNNTGAKGSVFLRINGDQSTNYSYSSDGFLNTVSTGSACGNVTAKQILLTDVNNFNSGVRFTANVNIDFQSVFFLTGNSMTQENTGNNAANASFAGSGNIGSLTSIQAWVGLMASCTVATDPLTGTTGSIWVWGVY